MKQQYVTAFVNVFFIFIFIDLIYQGTNRRERDLEVPATRHSGRPVASAASYSHQTVPS